MTTRWLCFVLGCHQEAIAGAVTTARGPVVFCRWHNVVKHGLARPLGPEPDQPATRVTVRPDPAIGGTKVPRVPIVPRRPSPAVANPF